MPQSLARIVLHITFSTKNRVSLLKDPQIRTQLHAYLAGALQNVDCEPVIVNGVEDHIHILCNFSRTITVASLIEHTKTNSSKWMKDHGPVYRDFYWQKGYGVFSVSESNVERVRAYIDGQEEHHRKLTFQDEFRVLCSKHGIAIDEKYVWD